MNECQELAQLTKVWVRDVTGRKEAEPRWVFAGHWPVIPPGTRITINGEDWQIVYHSFIADSEAREAILAYTVARPE